MDKFDDSVGWTTCDENDSNVTVPEYSTSFKAPKNSSPGDGAGAELSPVRLAHMHIAQLAGAGRHQDRLAEGLLRGLNRRPEG